MPASNAWPLIDVVAFDWNCPQHITQRFTEAQVAAATQPLRDRIAELEARLGGDAGLTLTPGSGQGFGFRLSPRASSRAGQSAVRRLRLERVHRTAYDAS